MERRPGSGAASTHGAHINVVKGSIGGSLVQARDIGELHVHLPERLPLPRQLPPAPVPFVNRAAEVALMDRLAKQLARPGGAPVLVLSGGHGVGKTATGRHWAHANSGRFPDGQLYVDFADMRVGGGVSVLDVLGGLLRSLGLHEDVIPSSLADRTALFRSRLAGKRVLILLDDARYAAEVIPLVPACATCCVLVTTRAPLRELVTDGAGLVRMEPLDEDSAELLLAEMLGVERVAAELEAVERLRAICAGLPVALRICGAQLAGRHCGRPIGWLVERLGDEQRRLGRLSTAPGRSLQVVFDEAYRDLGDGATALYRTLGAMPVATFSLVAIAHAAAPMTEVEAAVAELADAHVLEDAGDQLRMHDLLRAHARSIARREDSEDRREAVIATTIEYYLERARHMDRAIVPDRLRFGPVPAPDDRAAFSGPAAALAWFEAERTNLIAVLGAAEEREQFSAMWQLAEAMWIAYNNHKHLDEAHAVYSQGVRAAEAVGDDAVRARMHQQLARAEIELGRFDDAEKQLQRAAELAPAERARLRGSILEFEGVLAISRHEYEAAIAPLERARELFNANGYRRGIALQEYMLGRAHIGSGRPGDAVKHLRRAEALLDTDSDVMTHGRVLLRLGQAELAAGRLEDAARALGGAIEVMRQADALIYVGDALAVLADVRRAQGAEDLHRRELKAALAIYVSLGSTRAAVIRERLGESE